MSDAFSGVHSSPLCRRKPAHGFASSPRSWCIRSSSSFAATGGANPCCFQRCAVFRETPVSSAMSVLDTPYSSIVGVSLADHGSVRVEVDHALSGVTSRFVIIYIMRRDGIAAKLKCPL